MPLESDILRFFQDGRWKMSFDDEWLTAAAPMVPKVRDLTLDEGADGSWVLAGKLREITAEVTIWPAANGWDLETTCSCEWGGCCPHAAALLLRAAKERQLGRLQSRGIAAAISALMPATREDRPVEPAEAAPMRQIRAVPQFALHVRREPLDRPLRLVLQSLGQAEPESWIVATAEVIYDGHRSILRDSLPAWTQRVTMADGHEALLIHDEAAENRAARELGELGLSSLRRHPAWAFLLELKARRKRAEIIGDRWFPDPSRLAVDAFWHRFRGEGISQLEQAGWQVTVDDAVGHRVVDADPGDWQRELSPVGGGWFDLSVGFEVAGVRYDLLPILIRLLENDFLEETLASQPSGYVYVPLANGDALRLPVMRLRRILEHFSAWIEPGFSGRVRVHAVDAATLASPALLDIPGAPELPSWSLPTPGAALPAIELPNGLQATLRHYQFEGFQWMQRLARLGLHGILADDMGLGKTLQTLAHILSEKQAGHRKPTLVVAPTSVLPNWQAEAHKFTPDLRVLSLSGANRRRDYRNIPYADVVLTSYALLHRDIKDLESFEFHLVILDEAQHIKNPQALVSKAACRLHAQHRLCLSGTPVENHLGELWSLMRFLIPGFLGDEAAFLARFRSSPDNDSSSAENLAILKRRMSPLVLRRNKDQVASELPPKTNLVHLIELLPAQKDLYEAVRATMSRQLREIMAARGGGGYQIAFLDALLKLRQICCDPRLLPAGFTEPVHESAKLDFLTDLLALLIEEGRRILLFSQFTSMLDLIANQLRQSGIDYLMLTGSSSDRGKLVADFQSGRVPLFLISLKAGGTGLNLTAADTVIHYDPWWNPAAEAQASDRAYRIGQDKPVFVHKLLCQDTVEQRIHQLQIEKAQLAARFLEGSDAGMGLDPAMIRSLLEDTP